MELGIVLAVCIFVFTIIIYLIKSFYKDEITSLKRLSRQDQQSIYNSHFTYLRILRREYANNILDPETLLNLDRKMYWYEKKVEKMNLSDFNFEIAGFWKKFPDIADFDVINYSEHYVKYKDETLSNFASMDDFDKSEAYLNIVKYMALLDRERNYDGHSIDIGTNLEDLKKTQIVYDNQRLECLGNEVIKRIRNEKNTVLFAKYEDDEFNVFPLLHLDKEHPAENHLGIHIKNTNENIVYGIFIDDVCWENFYRSDKNFKKLEDIGQNTIE
jgi:hypothetical protein